MDALTFASPTGALSNGEKGWQRLDQTAVWGPEQETIVPTTGAGANTTVFEARRAGRITVFIEYTGDQPLTLSLLIDYARTSDGMALRTGFITDGGTLAIAAGSVNTLQQYITIENTAPFMQVNAVAAAPLTVGNLKLTLFASSHSL